MQRRSTHTPRTEKQERKQANTVFNEVQQFAYVLGAREREIIDSTINYKRILEGCKRDIIHKGSNSYL